MNQITFTLSPGMTGPAVADLQDGLRLLINKGEFKFDATTSTEPLKALSVERERTSFGPTTFKLVGIWQKLYHIDGNGTVDARTAASLNAALDKLGAFNPPPATPPTTPTNPPSTPPSSPQTGNDGPPIYGQVTNEGDEPLTDLKVTALRLTLGNQVQTAGQTTTDDKGGYRIVCERVGLAGFYVVSVAIDGRELVRSAPICQNVGEIRVDLVVVDLQFRMATEYQRMVLAVTPHLGDIEVTALTDTDLDILACVTGLLRTQLDCFRADAVIRGDSGIVPGSIYGMVRLGLPGTAAGLLAESEDVCRQVLMAAVAQRIAPELSPQEIERILLLLQGMSVDQALAQPASDSISPLLAVAIPEPALQRALLTAYVTNDGTAEDFWSQTLPGVAGFENAQTRDQLRLVVGLGVITLGHAPLVQALVAGKAGFAITDLRDVTKITADRWAKLIAGSTDSPAAGAPAGVPGDTPADSAANYARIVANLAAEAFPTAAVAAHFATIDDVALRAAGSVLDARPDLDLAGPPVSRFIASNPDVAKTLGESGVTALTQVQRLFKVTPTPQEIVMMRSSGFNSAWSIAKATPQDFARQWTGAGGDSARGLALHELATQRAETSFYLVSKFSDQFSGFGPAATPVPSATANMADKATLTELFGTESLCMCEDFEALDGPYAYYVAIISSLTQEARTILKGRRPDLWRLRFTEPNYGTQDRYLTFALEILENVALDQQRALANPVQASQPWPDNQTTWTEEQLSAGPEHPNPDAYVALQTAAFPWSLPFDAAGEEARAFGQLLGLNRLDLMVALQNRKTMQPSDVMIASEFLGINNSAWNLITNDAGTAGNPALEVLYPGNVDFVSDLLDRTGLEPDELGALLETRFVNFPSVLFAQRVGLASPDGSCNATNGTILNLDDPARNRIHRFVRLWRCLGWSMSDLDRAIWALSDGMETAAGLQPTLDAATLLRIAHLALLRKSVNVPLEEMLTWWAPIDSCNDDSTPSQYERLFLDETLGGTVDSAAFALADPPPAPAVELKVTTEAMAAHLPRVLAGLGINAEDLAQLAPAGAVLNLATLSALYRAASLARALKLSVRDYVDLRSLIPVDPFADPGNALEFMEAVAKMKSSAFSVPEMRYLLADELPQDPNTNLGISDADVDVLLDGLRAALITEAASASAAAALPPTRATWQSQLGTWLEVGDATTATEILEGTSALGPADQQNFVATQLTFLDTAAQEQLLAPLPPAEPQRSAAIAARYGAVIPTLDAFLGQRAREALVIKRLASQSQLTLEVTAALLASPFTSPLPLNGAAVSPIQLLVAPNFWSNPADPNSATAARAIVRRLDKLAILVSKLHLTADELPRIVAAAADGSRQWLDPNQLPVGGFGLIANFDAIAHLIDYAALRDRQPRGAASLFDVFTLAATAAQADVGSAILPAVAVRMDWDLTGLQQLTTTMGLTDPADFRDERGLARLLAAFTFLARSGQHAAVVVAWISTDLVTAAGQIGLVARSYVGVDQWAARVRPIRDQLLAVQRDALLAYLKGVGLPGLAKRFPDEKDFLDRYHLDAKMGPGFLTTRLELALTSVQYFTERCLIGEENLVTPLGESFAEQHRTFLYSFRIWQAAVAIVRTSWAYTDILLLDRKNDRYQTFERALNQQNVTKDNINDAIVNYLSEMSDLAKLSIAGIYEEAGPPNCLHVVACTPATPPIYYYAVRTDTTWSAWQKITADINTQDAVMPVVVGGLLHVFWPLVSQKADATQANQTVPSQGESVPPSPDPSKHLEMQVAWTVLKDGKWTSKRISSETVSLEGQALSTVFGLDPIQHYREAILFKAAVVQVPDDYGSHPEVRIICSTVGDASSGFYITGNFSAPEFRFKSLLKNASTASGIRPQYVTVPPGTETSYGVVQKYPGAADGLTLMDGNLPPVPDANSNWPKISFTNVPVLKATPGAPFELVFSHQYSALASQSLFFADDRWTFFVEHRPKTFNVNAARTQDVAAIGLARSRFLPYRAAPTVAVHTAKTEVAEQPIEANQQALATVPSADGPRPFVPLQKRPPADDWSYRFYTFCHPRMEDFIDRVESGGIAALLRWDPDNPVQDPPAVKKDFFVPRYSPAPAVDPSSLHLPSGGVEFDEKISPHAVDNQHLFYFNVLRASVALTTAGKFDDAEWYLRAIFDPNDGSSDSAPTRFWKYKPFRDAPRETVSDFLALLSGSGDAADTARAAVRDWVSDPFNPWRVARHHPVALMKTTVRYFVLNILTDADTDYAGATSQEPLLRALAKYIRALEILGPIQPAIEPSKSPDQPGQHHCYADFDGKVGQTPALPEVLESALPPLPASKAPSGNRFPFASSVQFAFCVPRDTTFDDLRQRAMAKLAGIRAGLDFDGQPRVYSVYGVRIDPMLLVRAASAGVDLTTALSALQAPRSPFRFAVLLQKAKEFTSELRTVSATMQAALSEDGNENVTELRADQETTLLAAMEKVKEQALVEANHTLEGLQAYLSVVHARNAYYKSRQLFSPGELVSMELTTVATVLQLVAQGIGTTAGVVRALPNFTVGVTGLGGSPTMTVTEGGENIGSGISEVSNALNMMGTILHAGAGLASTIAGYRRRKDEWDMLAATTALEIAQITAQINAQQARVGAATEELNVLAVQQANAQAIKDLLDSRANNKDLRQFRIAQLSSACHQGYLLAFAMSKAAERAYQFEYGYFDGTQMPQQSFIQFGYWQNNVNGTTAAEQLGVALQHLESAHVAQPREKYGVIKVSLALTDPLALESLRRNGTTGSFTLDEEIVASVFPEAYFVRIRHLRVTVPHVVGPYSNVPFKVALTRHSIRLTDDLTTPGGGYARSGPGDARFYDVVGQTETMYTSSARDDDGMPPGSEADGQYRWFESAGVVGCEFEVSFVKQLGRIDAESISDLILEFDISFREGSPDYCTKAIEHLLDYAKVGYRLLRARTDFPSEWARFQTPADPTAVPVIRFPIAPEQFPLSAQGSGLVLSDLLVLIAWQALPNVPVPAIKASLTVPTLGLLAPTNPQGDTAALLKALGHALPVQLIGFDMKNVSVSALAPAQGSSLALAFNLDGLPDEYTTTTKINGQDVTSIRSEAIEDIAVLCHYSK